MPKYPNMVATRNGEPAYQRAPSYIKKPDYKDSKIKEIREFAEAQERKKVGFLKKLFGRNDD